nr:MAG TPA: hypothetical protein [Caudoviricetes sp.]
MTRKEMQEKCRSVFVEMNTLAGTSDDMDVLLDKLIYMNNKKQGRQVSGNDEYPVPDNFDWAGFEVDYQELVRPVKEA